MTLAERIKQARGDVLLTQQQLADLVGSSKRSIAYWEADHRQPEFKFVVRIADATDKPLEFFAEAVRRPQ